MKRTLLLGVGNLMRGDDGIGCAAAEKLWSLFGGEADFEEFAGHSLDFLGLIEGYERVIVVDSLVGGQLSEGECAELELAEELLNGEADFSSHNASLVDALKTAKRLNLSLPRCIRFFGIGIKESSEIKRGLSDRLERRVEEIAKQIYREVSRSDSLREQNSNDYWPSNG